jgi:hypothetical protein
MKKNENELLKEPETVNKNEKVDKTHPNYHKEVSQAIEDLENDDSDEPEF